MDIVGASNQVTVASSASICARRRVFGALDVLIHRRHEIPISTGFVRWFRSPSRILQFFFSNFLYLVSWDWFVFRRIDDASYRVVIEFAQP